jgi:hypothetical protein
MGPDYISGYSAAIWAEVTVVATYVGTPTLEITAVARFAVLRVSLVGRSVKVGAAGVQPGLTNGMGTINGIVICITAAIQEQQGEEQRK